MKGIIDGFAALGAVGYVVLAMFVLSIVVGIVMAKNYKKTFTKWVEEHPGAVRINLRASMGVITQHDLRANVISGEAAVFMEKSGYVVYAMPGKIILEVTYTYTRPGVLYKRVHTTWGPSNVELDVEAGKEYNLEFNKDEERFILSTK